MAKSKAHLEITTIFDSSTSTYFLGVVFASFSFDLVFEPIRKISGDFTKTIPFGGVLESLYASTKLLKFTTWHS